MENISKMTIVQLKDYMRTNKIKPLSGKKHELIDRINMFNNGNTTVIKEEDIIKPKNTWKENLLKSRLLKKNSMSKPNITIDIANTDALSYMQTVPDNSIDLILTDPPYIISKDSGMQKQFKSIKESTSGDVKTEEQWQKYKQKYNIQTDKDKDNYIKYGSVLGKKFAFQTDYGEWDKGDFTMNDLEEVVNQYYKKLKKRGTAIIWFDIWKITDLKSIMENAGFKQIRFIEWIKTNPVPINSKINYLSNAREIALVGVKGSNPTFNSEYDNGIYRYPIERKNRFHPTQKNVSLFEDLIKKHSNEYDTVMDTFLGSGTTAYACKNTNRNFRGCELSTEYYDKIMDILSK
jgi:site-specific DNA-methyltransferase (adenine-specific)